MSVEKARPVCKGLCKCCGDHRDRWLYLHPTLSGLVAYCVDCCRSLGSVPGRTSDGTIIPHKPVRYEMPKHRR